MRVVLASVQRRSTRHRTKQQHARSRVHLRGQAGAERWRAHGLCNCMNIPPEQKPHENRLFELIAEQSELFFNARRIRFMLRRL
ncbi:hypothetical protein, partial [Stenotrophomonas maltophilia]|uniref:hypothetical protein n=1 Tax=Stenotrophomonas maltophilia TaxID=40324 RepID=UPI001E346E5E